MADVAVDPRRDLEHVFPCLLHRQYRRSTCGPCQQTDPLQMGLIHRKFYCRRRINPSSWSRSLVADGQQPALALGADADLQPQLRGQPARQLRDVRIRDPLGARPRLGPARLQPHQRLGLAHIEAALDHLPGQRLGAQGCRSARGHGRPTGGHPRAAPAPPAAGSAGAACWRHGCGSCRSPPPAPPGCAELVDQPPVGLGLLQRRQVGALQVLDQRQLERLLVGELAHDDRHLVQARPAAPPASAARRPRSRSPPHRRRQGGPGAAAGRRARGSTAPAPRARPRRSGGAAAGATGAGTRSAPAAPPAGGLSPRRSRRRRPAAPTGPCRARGVRWALPPALMPRPAGARGAASRRRGGRRPGRPRS